MYSPTKLAANSLRSPPSRPADFLVALAVFFCEEVLQRCPIPNFSNH